MPRKKIIPPVAAPPPKPTAAKVATPKTAPPRPKAVPASPPSPPKEWVVEGPDGRRITGKFAILIELLRRTEGATIANMCEVIGWQKHSIRGALAGALKKLGYEITSDKPGDERIYRIAPPPTPKVNKASGL